VLADTTQAMPQFAAHCALVAPQHGPMVVSVCECGSCRVGGYAWRLARHVGRMIKRDEAAV
jgi:hypothetical protein